MSERIVIDVEARLVDHDAVMIPYVVERRGVLPVSYTHLDVYKRQAWNRVYLDGKWSIVDATLVAMNYTKKMKGSDYKMERYY